MNSNHESDYSKRETKKANAWEMYRSSTTIEERVSSMILIMETHYSRNPESIPYPIYASHWGYAQQFNFSKEEIYAFREKFPLKGRPKIELSCTDWDSFGHRGYAYIREQIFKQYNLTKLPPF